MDWKLEMEAERAVLQRIAAVLLALADLAELAGSRSQAVRGLVLWLLLPAEAMARNLVAGSPAPVPLCRAGNSPADAIRLALSLRSLAASLGELSRLRFPTGGSPDARFGVSIPDTLRRIAAFATTLAEAGSLVLRDWRRTLYDTS